MKTDYTIGQFVRADRTGDGTLVEAVVVAKVIDESRRVAFTLDFTDGSREVIAAGRVFPKDSSSA